MNSYCFFGDLVRRVTVEVGVLEGSKLGGTIYDQFILYTMRVYHKSRRDYIFVEARNLISTRSEGTESAVL
jgi:hypothetical protein